MEAVSIHPIWQRRSGKTLKNRHLPHTPTPNKPLLPILKIYLNLTQTPLNQHAAIDGSFLF